MRRFSAKRGKPPKAALTTADATPSRIIDALLHEALEPDTDALEAIE